MCRLLGICSKKVTGINYYFFNADKKPFKDFSKEHSDGFGIGWYEKYSPVVYKEGKDEVNSYNFEKVKEVKSQIVISHLRRASQGIKTTRNAHPFCYKNWIFAHNGFIIRAEALIFLEDKYKKMFAGETDSEVFFLLLMQFYEKTNNLSQSLKETLKIIKNHPYKGLNFLLSDGEFLYAYRNASPNVRELFDYYSLHYLVKKDHIVISSDPLTKEKWTSLRMGELLIIDKNLKIETIKII